MPYDIRMIGDKKRFLRPVEKIKHISERPGEMVMNDIGPITQPPIAPETRNRKPAGRNLKGKRKTMNFRIIQIL